MKTNTKTLFALSALAGLSFTAAQAATLTWDNGGHTNENWNNADNWDGTPAGIPTSGVDSVELTDRNVLNYDFTVASGQSITDTAGSNWLGLANDGWGTVANLTLATGGSIDVGYIAARGNNPTLNPSFTIEHGATLATDTINDGARPMDLIWEAGAASVTTWGTADIVSIDDFIVTVDLTAYTVAGASSLSLIAYSGTLDTTFNSVTVTDGAETLVNGVDYTLSYGDLSNDAITLNLIPEPGTYALIGGMLALGYVMVRRRR